MATLFKNLTITIKGYFFNKQFYRFIFVGIVNTAFSYSIYYLLCQTALPISIALALSTVMGIVFNYFSTGRLVFGNRGSRCFMKFILVYVTIYLINLLALCSLIVIGLPPEISQALLLPIIALLTFLVMKEIVFREILEIK